MDGSFGTKIDYLRKEVEELAYIEAQLERYIRRERTSEGRKRPTKTLDEVQARITWAENEIRACVKQEILDGGC